MARLQKAVTSTAAAAMVGAPLAFVFLAAAVLPFARDIARFLRRPA